MINNDLLENKDLREKLVGRVDVLEKVKELILLPSTDIATTEQVAEYYNVTIDVIRKVVQNNNEEIKDDGYRVIKRKEIEEVLKGKEFTLKSMRGKSVVTFIDGCIINVTNNGLALFTRRAILRIGMLLRDSEVAKEIRTFLLNLEERLNEDQKNESINDLDEETKAIIDIVNSKDEVEIAMALNKYKQIKDGKIHKLEVENEILVDGILKWDKRKVINKMVRLLGANKYRSSRYGFMQGWDLVCNELLYKYSINVNSRKTHSKLKKPTIFDVLEENEIDNLLKVCVALCKKNNINTDGILIA